VEERYSPVSLLEDFTSKIPSVEFTEIKTSERRLEKMPAARMEFIRLFLSATTWVKNDWGMIF